MLIVCCFRTLLHQICQELTRDDVSNITYLCGNIIARSKREQIKDFRELLYVLEQKNVVQPANLHFLSSLLAEIRRHDLAQKVHEHCQRHGVHRLEDDNAVLPNSYGTSGQVTPSFVSPLPPHNWPEIPNEVVTFKHARVVLEPDDALPVMPSSQYSAEPSVAPIADDPHIVHSDSLTQIDYILQTIEEMFPGGTEVDLPRYDMSSDQKGNICTVPCNCCCFFVELPTCI